MTIEHYPAIVEIWRRDAGIGLGPGDEKAGMLRYLQRNAGMSFIAKSGARDRRNSVWPVTTEDAATFTISSLCRSSGEKRSATNC